MKFEISFFKVGRRRHTTKLEMEIPIFWLLQVMFTFHDHCCQVLKGFLEKIWKSFRYLDPQEKQNVLFL